jgi:CheY-like chemotaxis protein
MNAIRKVLVVDDDPVVSKSFDRVLARKGYVVVSAENGAEALNKFSKEDFDAVFTDIKMPGMDGLEVAERLRAKRPWTPVLIITGYGSAENEKRAEAAGVRGFLRKPLSPEMIETSLDAAVAMALPAPAGMVPEVAAAVALDTGGTALVAARPAAVGEESTGKNIARSLSNIAMFFAAPFVALAFVLLLPPIGLAALAWMAGKAWLTRSLARKIATTLYNVGLFFAAPFVALAYIILLPPIGLVMLAGMGGKALLARIISA